jgi:hypothetical protein
MSEEAMLLDQRFQSEQFQWQPQLGVAAIHQGWPNWSQPGDVSD